MMLFHNKNRMKILLTILIGFGLLSEGFAQEDSLYTKRKFLTTYICQNHEMLTNAQIKKQFGEFKQAEAKYKLSKILIPTGVATTAGGFFLAYKALKGERKSVDYVGEILTYTDRSLSKLLIGLGCITVGVSFIESGNELIQKAAKIYNIESKKKKMGQASQTELKMGITSTGGLGFQLKF